MQILTATIKVNMNFIILKPNIFQVVLSVLAAMFGVQSAKNRARDFSKGSAKEFIIVGVILVLLLILFIFLTVKIVLSAYLPV